jgi:hypothetical protein
MHRKLLLTDICIDRTQTRAKIRMDVVDEYMVHIADLPMPVVFFDGAQYFLGDGFHRYHAAHKAGMKEIICEVVVGTIDEAIWYACGANKEHGIQRSNADKRKAVLMALKLRPADSDREIATHVGVDHGLVSKLRASNTKKQDSSRMAETPTCHSDDTQEQVKDYAAPAEPEPEPVDAGGEVIPKQCRETWGDREELKEIMADLQRIKERCKVILGTPVAQHISRQKLLADLQSARHTIGFGLPQHVCPYCAARNKQCKACKGVGLVSKTMFQNFTPEEVKT